MRRLSLLLLLLVPLLMLTGPLSAQTADDDSECAISLDDCHAALGVAARIQKRRGELSKPEFRQLKEFLRSDANVEDIALHAELRLKQRSQRDGVEPRFDFITLLLLLIENWDEIWAIIQQIIDALSYDVPIAQPALAQTLPTARSAPTPVPLFLTA